MRILYFSFVELDIPNACQVHTLGILAGFGENESEIDAVVPRPKRILPNIPGVSFYHIWPWRFSLLGKLWVKLIGSLYFFTLCLLNSYDIIYVREMESNPFPRRCAKLFKIPYFIEVNGILLLDLKKKGVGKNRLQRVEKHQKRDYEQASGLIITSCPRSKWVKNYYNLEKNKIFTHLNGALIPDKKKLERTVTLNNLNLPADGFYLGFLGSLWKYYDTASIIEALRLCKYKFRNIYLLIVGGGPDLPFLKRVAKNKGVSSNIIELGFIQPQNLYKVLGAFDIGLMNMTKEGLIDLGPFTTRFATYASFKIPVIVNDSELKNAPKELTEGLYSVPPENPEALAKAILWLNEHPKERKEKAKILFDYFINNLTWNQISNNISRFILNKRNHI
jgi:glycosyltransferase involved in cell wall biosynthesis